MALKLTTTIVRGNDKVMRERQRVEILRDLLSAQGFLSIADLMVAASVPCVTGAA